MHAPQGSCGDRAVHTKNQPARNKCFIQTSPQETGFSRSFSYSFSMCRKIFFASMYNASLLDDILIICKLNFKTGYQFSAGGVMASAVNYSTILWGLVQPEVEVWKQKALYGFWKMQ